MDTRRIVIVGARGFWNMRSRVLDMLPSGLHLHFDDALGIDGEKWSRVCAVVVADQTVDAALMERYRNLKVIARTGTGYDAIDVPEAHRRGIIVTRVAKQNAEATSEFALTVLFALAKNLTPLHSAMLRSKWAHASGPLYGTLLSDMTVGVVGLGHVGRSVVRKLDALGVGHILGWNRSTRVEMSGLYAVTRFARTAWDTLFKTSDAVILSLALTQETKGIVSANTLALMKPTAFLINVSRGSVVDEEALAEAVGGCKLGGVALDVFSTEPPPDWTLFEKPFMRSLMASAEMGRNVILTPHNASRTKNVVLHISEQVARNISGVLTDSMEGVEIVE